MRSLAFAACVFFLSLFTYAQDSIPIPAGQVGKEYDQILQVDGGLAPYKCKIIMGQLPPGLRILAAGEIVGTPTAKGSYKFLLKVSESSKARLAVTQVLTITINPSPFRVTGFDAVRKPAATTRVDKLSLADIPGVHQRAVKVARPILISLKPTGRDKLSGTVATGVSEKTPTPDLIGDPHPLPTATDPPQAPPPSGPNASCGFEAESTGLCGGQMLRTIVGFEQAGVSGAQSKQDFFFDLLYDRPIAFQLDSELGPALRGWGDLRISSVPQQITTSVAQFASTFAQQVGQLKVNQVAQSFEFLGGLKYRLYAPARQSYAGPDDGGQHRISINFLIGGGVITPLSPIDSVQIFSVPVNQPSFLAQYPQTAGKQFVAFTLEDRNRFFRQAYTGLRLETHYLQSSAVKRFPEMFDLTYGFDEAVTGGRIRGGVLRLEGFVPIPYSKASWVYLFGTGIFKPGGHALTTNPFLLDQAPTGTLPTDPGAVVISTPQEDRDYYRVGFGIDFINLVCIFSNSCGK